jgi:hypothetical protein
VRFRAGSFELLNGMNLVWMIRGGIESHLTPDAQGESFM